MIIQSDYYRFIRRLNKAAFSFIFTKLSSCNFINLQSTYHTYQIIRMKLSGSFRITFFKPFKKLIITKLGCFLFQLLSDIQIGFYIRKLNIVNQRGDIKSRSADYYRQTTTFMNLIYFFISQFHIICYAERSVTLQKVNKMMRNTAHFLLCRLRSRNIHTLIYLHRICRNHFSVKRLGNFNAQFSFSRSGRTCNNSNFYFFHSTVSF